jgi:hypothetical protein
VQPPIRTEEVRPPSLRRESGLVLKAAFHIAYWSALVIFGHPETPGVQAAELPFERRFQDLDAADQRVFRAIQEGIVEAEGERSRSGRWPAVEALARQGVPPFALDPIDKAGYGWRLLQKQTLLNYVGTPAPESGRRAFVVLITEPEPGTPVDLQTPVDDQHHRLASGTMIHVSVWLGPGLGDMREPAASVNPDEGWQRVVVSESPPRSQ